MAKLYEWIDRLWQWIAKTVFVRFEFSLPVEELRKLQSQGRLTFTITQGGLTEWLILSSWCRTQGLGAILVANRKRVLFFAKPKYFLQIVFRRRSYSDLFLSAEHGPRLLFCSASERKRPFDPTPVEKLLADLYSATSAGTKTLVPVFLLWRKHMRTSVRSLSELLFGLSSNPNVIGKVWYLVRRRKDSTVRSLPSHMMGATETVDYEDAFDDSEPMKVAKSTRRKILVQYHQEMRVVLGPRYSSPISVKETLLKDPELQEVIRKVAESEGVDRRKVMSRAYQNLTEIVSNYKFRFIEVMYVMLTWLFTKVFDGLEADESELHAVREIMKTKPVVFIPCHRSHLDYLVIPYVMFIHDMVTPHTAAGINLAFWPVGPFLRMGGAFFIRRSFRGDIVYSTCLRKYVQFLLQNRFNVKFFIEGTRSRSGKMLPPAYGMLKMVLEAYQNKVCDDIALVPVSLCYDEVPEQGAYTKELAGGQKVKESARELIRSRKLVKRNIGKVYVKFAKPMYAKEIYSSGEVANLEPTLMLQKTAFQISKAINDVTPITAKSLVCSALLTSSRGALSLENILRLCVELRRYVDGSGHPLSVANEEAFKRSVEETVRRLVKSSVLTVSDEVPRGYYCEPRKRILLNFYKNNALHCLVSPAITVLAFLSTLTHDGILAPAEFREKMKSVALDLRNVLKFDFFFNPTVGFLEEMDRNMTLLLADSGWKDRLIPDLVEAFQRRFPDPQDLCVYVRLLGDLLESYAVALQCLREPSVSGGTVEKKMWLQRVVKFAEVRAAQGAISFPESITTQNYGTALQLLDNQQFVELVKEADKTTLRFKRWDESMSSLAQRLQSWLDLMEENPKGFFG